MSGYVYIKSEPNRWTVGFYGPVGRMVPESDHPSTADAAARVNYLNGGSAPAPDDGNTFAASRLAEVRAVLTAFSWEHDDRQYALERIDAIVNRSQL